MNQQIDKNKYLGKLCKRGHEYEDMVKSLRTLSGACVECSHKRYMNNKEASRVRGRKYLQENYEKVRKRKRTEYRRYVEVLTDNYCMKLIVGNTTLRKADIDDSWIKLKREQIKLKRAQIKLKRFIKECRKNEQGKTHP